jgi:uncharacterized membrane protein
VIALAAITLGGGILRFLNLSQGAWFDEAVTVRDVSGSFTHVFTAVGHNELSPPLYFVCVWLWRHVFGSSAADMRALSALAGTAMIPIAFLGARRIFRARTGIVAAALVASNSTLLYYSQELRGYALLSLLCGLGFLTFLAVLDCRRPGSLWCWVGLSLLALATQYYAWLVVAPEAVILLAQARRGQCGLRATSAAVGAVGAGAIALAAFAASQYSSSYRYVGDQLSSPFQAVHFSASWAALGNVPASFAQQLTIGQGGPAKTLTAAAVEIFAIAALVLLSRHPDDLHRRRAAQLLLLAAVGAVVAAGWFALHLPMQGRYLLPLWLPATLTIAYAFSSSTAGKIGPALAAGLCGLWLVIGIVSFTTATYSAREDTRAIAHALGTAHADRLVAVDDAWDLLPMRVYLPAASTPTDRVVDVTEVDVIAMPETGFGFPSGGDHPAPALPTIASLPRSLVLKQIVRGSNFAIERFVSGSPVALRLDPAARIFNNNWRFLLERSGAQISGL